MGTCAALGHTHTHTHTGLPHLERHTKMWRRVLSRVGTCVALGHMHTHTHTPAGPTWKDTQQDVEDGTHTEWGTSPPLDTRRHTHKDTQTHKDTHRYTHNDTHTHTHTSWPAWKDSKMWGMVLSRVGTFAAPWTHTHTHTPACPTWKDTARCGECCSDRVRTCAALGLTHRHTNTPTLLTGWTFAAPWTLSLSHTHTHTPTPFDWSDLRHPLDTQTHTHTPTPFDWSDLRRPLDSLSHKHTHTHTHTHPPTPFDWSDLCSPLDSHTHTHPYCSPLPTPSKVPLRGPRRKLEPEEAPV